MNMSNVLKFKVEHIGTIKLILASNYVLNLSHTAFIPSIRRNLISVSILDKCGYVFYFRNGKAKIFYNSFAVGSNTLYDGLYKIEFLPTLDYTSSRIYVVNVVVGFKLAKSNEISSMLWHKRLDHISRERIERLIKYGIIVYLNFFQILKLVLLVSNESF